MRTDPWFELARQQCTLSFVVHAGSKVGKTTLTGTAPKPLLLLDAEGGTKFLPYVRTHWDPLMGPPPMPDGTWEVCVVTVRTYETMHMVYQWLAMGQHGFASLSVDSVTEVQRRCKASIAGTDALKQDGWGQLLDKMLGLVRDFRDLTLHPTNPLSVVTFVAETKERNGKWRPFMQGQLQDSLPYTVDLLGYLYVAQVADPALVDAAGVPIFHPQRQLLVAADDPNIEAGERVQGRLGRVVVEPDLTRMLAQVYGIPTQGE